MSAGTYVIFTEDGIPGWFGPDQIDGAEWVEGVDHEVLLTCRRVNGDWVLRPPVPPLVLSAEQIVAAREAEYEAACEARDQAIDTTITASAVYRQFIRGEMTLTAYRLAASDIAASFPMPDR